MKKEEIGFILEKQRNFFATGKTLDIDFRIGILKKLRSLILSHEEELIDALSRDFHKPRFEVLGTESKFVVAELNLIIRNLRRWSRKKRVRTSLANFPAGSYMMPQPSGQAFETFSNMKSVMVKSNLVDIPVRYPPYTVIKEKLLKLLLK